MAIFCEEISCPPGQIYKKSGESMYGDDCLNYEEFLGLMH